MKNKKYLLGLGLISFPIVALSAACTNEKQEEDVPHEVLHEIDLVQGDILKLENETNAILAINDGENVDLDNNKSIAKEYIKKIKEFLKKLKRNESSLIDLRVFKDNLKAYLKNLKAAKSKFIHDALHSLKTLNAEVRNYIDTELVDEHYEEIKKNLNNDLKKTIELIKDIYIITKQQLIDAYKFLKKQLEEAKKVKQEIINSISNKIEKLKIELDSKITKYKEYAEQKFSNDIRNSFLDIVNKAFDTKNKVNVTEQELKDTIKKLDEAYNNALLNSAKDFLTTEIAKAKSLIQMLTNKDNTLFKALIDSLTEKEVKAEGIIALDPIQKDKCLSEYESLTTAILKTENDAKNLAKNLLSKTLEEATLFYNGNPVRGGYIVPQTEKDDLKTAIDEATSKLEDENATYYELYDAKIEFDTTYMTILAKLAFEKLGNKISLAEKYKNKEINNKEGNPIDDSKVSALENAIEEAKIIDEYASFDEIQSAIFKLERALEEAGY